MLPDTAARPGVRIGRYRVMGRIGRGGMGMVYRGLDETLEREVALKTLTIEGTLDEESRRRFEVEAKAAARLQHPNIVTVFELSEDRGVPFIAMELLPGIDLESLIRAREPLLLQEKLDIAIQICRGLAFAHEHGIVHRDVKPSNVRLLDDGTVKIMDFGIAKLGGTSLTKSGMMVGTVHYMSPEQVRGRTLDGRSDVFSVGVILYELLSGHRPFRGGEATEILYKIVHEEPAALDPAQLGGIPSLHEIVNRALAKDVDRRYPTASALAEDLARVVQAQASTSPRLPLEVEEALDHARRLLKQGRTEDGLARLREISERHDTSVEVRRALRGAARAMQRSKVAREPETTDFPELEATFQVPPTRKADAALQPTVLEPPPTTLLEPRAVPAPLPSPSRRPPIAILAGLGLVALVLLGSAAVWLSRGQPRGAPSPASAEVRLPVRSQPAGATVLVDGEDSGVVTDGELVFPRPLPEQVTLTFRKPGLREVTRAVRLPPAPGERVSVTLEGASGTFRVVSDPPGAAVLVDGEAVKGATPVDVVLDGAAEHRVTVSLEGRGSKDVVVAPGQSPGELLVKLEAIGPMGTVAVESGYPVNVLWKGRLLARGQEQARVEVPAGRQVLTLVAPTYFLRADLSVAVPPNGEARIEAPALGRLNVRAVPDNCEVFVDGRFADYPPIHDRRVASGLRTVSFKWPDGAMSEQKVEVRSGASAFVTGRKE